MRCILQGQQNLLCSLQICIVRCVVLFIFAFLNYKRGGKGIFLQREYSEGFRSLVFVHEHGGG